MFTNEVLHNIQKKQPNEQQHTHNRYIARGP